MFLPATQNWEMMSYYSISTEAGGNEPALCDFYAHISGPAPADESDTNIDANHRNPYKEYSYVTTLLPCNTL